MDLSILRQSLHRLALLEDGSPPEVRLSTAVGGQVWPFPERGIHGPPAMKQSQQQGPNSKGPEGKQARRHSKMMDPGGIRHLLPRSSQGGGIRVYHNQGDDWVLSSSHAGRRDSVCDQNLSAQRSPLMRLRVLMNGVTALLCVSLGSNINILKLETAKRARFSLIKMEPPVWISLDKWNGRGPRIPVDHRVSLAPYQIDGFFAQDDFLITPTLTTSYVDGIVGIDWLEKYKPTINYRLNRIELIDLRGRVHVIESVPGSERAGRGENETQWITARMWDWDLKAVLNGQHRSEDDASAID